MVTVEILKAVRIDVEKAIAEIVAKHGLEKGSLGTMRYGQDDFRATLEFKVKSNKPKGVLIKMPNPNNLQEFVGKVFKSKKTIYTVMSVENSKLLCKTQRGAQWLISPAQLLEMDLIKG